MANNTKVKTLIDTYEMARNLSKYYISKLEGIDLKKQYEFNGVKFNSAYWIVAHLAWTEHFLIIEGIGGDAMGIEWLNDFGFGSVPDDVKNEPSYEEVLKTLSEIHTKAIDILGKMTDEELAQENNINANFGGKTNKEVVLMHAIRHEPMHIGQLSWILKASGVKMA
jgi:uncharacterized damage-inducible protein DinB